VSYKNNRDFVVKDDIVIVHAGVTLNNYVTHQTRFEEFNPVKFSIEFVANYGLSVTAAENTMSDGFILQSQAKETSDVDGGKKVCITLLRKLEYFVDDAFAGDEKIISKFRLSKTKIFAGKTDIFIGFIKDVLVTVAEYEADLILKGLTRELIMELKDALDNLDTQRREQIEAIQSRPLHTKNRIDKMNDLWQQLVSLDKASSFVFATEPEIKKLFDLPRPRISSSSDSELELVNEKIGEQGSSESVVAE
jgi:hypothetical protein